MSRIRIRKALSRGLQPVIAELITKRNQYGAYKKDVVGTVSFQAFVQEKVPDAVVVQDEGFRNYRNRIVHTYSNTPTFPEGTRFIIEGEFYIVKKVVNHESKNIISYDVIEEMKQTDDSILDSANLEIY